MLIGAHIAFSQNDPYRTKLETQLTSTSHDTTRARIYIDLAEYISEEEDWMSYNRKALKLANGHLKSAEGKERLFYVKIKAHAIGNLGYYYDEHGNMSKSIDYYFESLRLYDEAKDESGKAAILGNLGIIYTNRGDYVEALDYLDQALKLKLKYDPDNVAKNYINLGTCLEGKGDLKRALDYYFMALKAAEKVNDNYDVSIASNNIGTWYFTRRNYALAKPYLKRAVDLSLLENDESGAAWIMANLSSCYVAERNYDSSIFYLSKASEIAERSPYPALIQNLAEKHFMYYMAIGDYKNAVQELQISEQMKDSMDNVGAQKTALRQKLEYDYNLEKTEEKLKREEEKKREEQRFYFILVGLILSAFFALFIYNRLRITKNQKKVIESQKLAVEQQKVIIEEKNGEIMDSINYAKRVQDAILPSLHHFSDSFEDYFLVYLPKDIVAGDFYWCYTTDTHIYFAVADCTGHGVPGALVSVVCANALERAVKAVPKASTGELLDLVTEYVIEQFAKEGAEVKDGMDIGFCCIDREKTTIHFSGAFNPCVIVRNGELIELKGDRRPIGKFIDDTKFTTHEFNVQKGDWIYLYTDGFQDQFGGTDGKKYKSSVFKNLLLAQAHETGEKQAEHYKNEISTWRGDLEQLDDVCIMGVKI